jgi:hypothetical protein
MTLGHRVQAVDGGQSARGELLPAGAIAKMTPNRSALSGSILMNGSPTPAEEVTPWIGELV